MVPAAAVILPVLLSGAYHAGTIELRMGGPLLPLYLAGTIELPMEGPLLPLYHVGT